MTIKDKYLKAHQVLVDIMAEPAHDTWDETKKFTDCMTSVCLQIQERLGLYLEREILEEQKKMIQKV